jgi:hypothetical protein
MSIIQVLVDATVPSEDEIVKKWDFKLGSVGRSIDDCLMFRELSMKSFFLCLI